MNGTHQCDFPNFCGQQCPTLLHATLDFAAWAFDFPGQRSHCTRPHAISTSAKVRYWCSHTTHQVWLRFCTSGIQDSQEGSWQCIRNAHVYAHLQLWLQILHLRYLSESAKELSVHSSPVQQCTFKCCSLSRYEDNCIELIQGDT